MQRADIKWEKAVLEPVVTEFVYLLRALIIDHFDVAEISEWLVGKDSKWHCDPHGTIRKAWVDVVPEALSDSAEPKLCAGKFALFGTNPTHALTDAVTEALTEEFVE